MKTFTIIFILFISIKGVWAQQSRFIQQGRITYEKKVNSAPLLREMYPENKSDNWDLQKVELFKKNYPQFLTFTTQLTFNQNNAYYETIKDGQIEVNETVGTPIMTAKNKVYQNLKTNQNKVLKKIYGENIYMSDSLQKIKWKITEEYREIAGYQCRRANGLILDSVYVVAFYTDQIVPSLGPESFHGLPGMILGLALPHLHISWFATKVEDRAVQAAEIKIPEETKAKHFNRKEFKSWLDESTKSWTSESGIYKIGLSL